MASTLLRSYQLWNLNAITLGGSSRLGALLQSRFSSDQSELVLANKRPTKQPSEAKAQSKQKGSLKVKKPSPKRLVPPKRPMNIMQLVTQDVISEYKEKHGKLGKEDARECFKIASEKYRSLSDTDKKNYIAELDRRREQYEVEMREFLDSLTPNDYINQNEYIRRRKAQGRSTGRKGIPRLDPNAPKRPLNGFMIFCAELRTNPSKFPELLELIQSSEKDANSSIIEGSKVLANYWKSMDEDLKQKYILEGQRRSDLYKQEKAQYDAQLKVSSR